MTIVFRFRHPFGLTEVVVVLTHMKHPSNPDSQVSFASIVAEAEAWNEQSEQLVFQ